MERPLHREKYHSKYLIDVSKLCGGLYFKRFEELNWAGYTFLKFKVSGLNITSDRLLVDEKNPQMTSFELNKQLFKDGQ